MIARKIAAGIAVLVHVVACSSPTGSSSSSAGPVAIGPVDAGAVDGASQLQLDAQVVADGALPADAASIDALLPADAVVPDAALVDALTPTDAAVLDGATPPDATPSDATLPDAGPDPTVAGGGWTPGTRLVPVTITGEDGSVQGGAGWYDTKLKQRCSFQLTSDGKRRCVPFAYYTLGFYLDSGCTTELILATNPGENPCGASPLVYASKPTTTTTCNEGSNQGTKFFTLGNKIPAPTDVYKLNSLGECKAQAASASVDYYPFGSEVDPSEFVAVTYSYGE